ncbi:MAG: hypothetical protein ABGX24_00180 [Aquificota bacterium]|jgi:hypothetical protein
MRKGEKEAKQGYEAEKFLIHLINNNAEVKRQIKNCLKKLRLGVYNELKAYPSKDRHSKTDIYLIDNQNRKIGISLKTVSTADFHQLDRRWLDDWKKILNMPENVYSIFKTAILRKAKNPKSTLIQTEEQSIIKNFIEKNLEIILNEIFRKKESDLKILAIFLKERGEIFFVRIDDIIDFFSKATIEFSKGGLTIGKVISLQRKGGNGKKIALPKTNWQHPGNQLQFKLRPLNYCKVKLPNT